MNQHAYHPFHHCCCCHCSHHCCCLCISRSCHPCPSHYHPTRGHDPSSITRHVPLPMRCNPSAKADTLRKRQDESKSKDTSVDQQFDSKSQHFPSVPCRRIISKRNRIHVSSTSFLYALDDQKNLLLSTMVKNDDQAQNPNSVVDFIQDTAGVTKKTKLSDAEAFRRSLQHQIKNDHLPSVQQHSQRNDIEETRDKRESPKKNSIIELSSNDVSIQSDAIHTLSSLGLTSFEYARAMNEKPHPPPLSSPPNLDRIKSNENVRLPPRSARSLTSLTRDRSKSSTEMKQSNGSLSKARSTIDFGFLIDEVITPTA